MTIPMHAETNTGIPIPILKIRKDTDNFQLPSPTFRNSDEQFGRYCILNKTKNISSVIPVLSSVRPNIIKVDIKKNECNRPSINGFKIISPSTAPLSASLPPIIKICHDNSDSESESSSS